MIVSGNIEGQSHKQKRRMSQIRQKKKKKNVWLSLTDRPYLKDPIHKCFFLQPKTRKKSTSKTKKKERKKRAL